MDTSGSEDAAIPLQILDHPDLELLESSLRKIDEAAQIMRMQQLRQDRITDMLIERLVRFGGKMKDVTE